MSTWDTFRALHPLLTIVVPEMVPDLVASMVEHYKQAGYLPIWALWGKD
ncbi:glycoside hydrolase family 92 protein, partial [bacterium]|nr:glycoside hydrolase family 92 protein [bacterium]